MVTMTGNLVLDGVSDKELVKILEVKVHHERLEFNPQQMQIGYQQEAPRSSRQPIQKQIYNNVVLQWKDEEGLKAIQEIVRLVQKKDEKSKSPRR